MEISLICSVYTRIRKICRQNVDDLRGRFPRYRAVKETHLVSAGSAVQQDVLVFTTLFVEFGDIRVDSREVVTVRIV